MIMETVRIGDLPDELKPFEKYQKQGIDRLSDIELLALILRTGTKKLLWQAYMARLKKNFKISRV